MQELSESRCIGAIVVAIVYCCGYPSRMQSTFRISFRLYLTLPRTKIGFSYLHDQDISLINNEFRLPRNERAISGV